MSYDFPTRTKPSSNQRWLMSFADLLSLILTFFVMLYSMTDPLSIIKKPKDNYNSAVEFQDGGKGTKIHLESLPSNFDNNYMESIIRDKIANDDGMRGLRVKIIDDKLTIYTSSNHLLDSTIQALYDTISPLGASTAVVADNLGTARAVAYKFSKMGMTQNLAYFADNNLQNNVKIIVYTKF